jgi:hypothetical protein
LVSETTPDAADAGGVQPQGTSGLALAGTGIAVGIAGLLLGTSALMPGLGLWDTGELQTVGPVLGTAHPTGFPAWVVLGWLASVVLGPVGEPALRMNVLSAILLGVAGGATAVAAGRLSGRWALGAAAGFGLVATPIAWRIGTRADVHALHLALVAVLIALLVEWAHRQRTGSPTATRWLVAVAVVVGVALANHRLTVFLLPGIAAYVAVVDPAILRRPRVLLGLPALALAVAAVLYLELPLRAGPLRAPLVYGAPETWEGFWYVVLGVQFGGAFTSPLEDPGRLIGELSRLLAGQLGPLAGLLLPAAVATVVRRPTYALLTIPGALATWLFATSYENADIERYYLGPAVFAWTWLAVGAGALLDLLMAAVRGSVEGGAGRRRWVAPAAAAGAAVLLVGPSIMALPSRHDRLDGGGDIVGRAWLEGAIETLEPDAVVVSWWSYSTPLWYAQHVEGRISGIWVVDDRTRLDEDLGSIYDVIDAQLGRRPVYAVRVEPSDLAGLVRRYRLESLPMPMGQSLTRILGPRMDP